jgi:hypothetical protein
MEFFMRRYFVDFDGVVINSQEKFDSVMKGNTNDEDWRRYLNSINFREFYKECEEIDEAFTSLRQLEKEKRLAGIITTIHSFHEGEDKVIYIRENGLLVPVFLVVAGIDKSFVCPPSSQEDTLVDDKLHNCTSWDNAGGDSIIFRPKQKILSKKSIRSLKELL